MKKVVIIGGGFTGAYCARALENDFETTLIDCKDYFEFTPGVLRTIVEPAHIHTIQSMHVNYLQNTRVVVQPVREVTLKEVIVKNEKIPYDYLIIASGSHYASPIKGEVIYASRAEDLHKEHAAVEKATSLAIIGGGLVGVELAAELVSHYPTKKITVLQADNEILMRNRPKSQRYARKYLEKRGVTILSNERVKKYVKGVILTQKGTKVKADKIFSCVGITPNSQFMVKQFKKQLSDRHFILVNQYLQLPRHENIFVGGDVTSIKEEKTAQTAEKHAKLIVQNIRAKENNQPLTAYTNKPRPMVISLGKYCGIVEYKSVVLTGLLSGMIKRVVEFKAMWKYR